MAFKLTYATMFNPPEELHRGFDGAVVKLKQNLGKEYSMIINGKQCRIMRYIFSRATPNNIRTRTYCIPD